MKRNNFLPIFFFYSLLFSCASSGSNEDALLLYMRSLDLYRTGRFRETVSMLASESSFVPSLVLRGKAEFILGDTGAAEGSLKRALGLKPNDFEAMLFLARVYRETGNRNEAQELSDKLLGENSMDIRALRLASDLSRDRGVSGEAAAIVFLDRAVEASMESALVFLDRARLRWIGGNPSAALDDLERARVLLPRDSPVNRAVENLESIIREIYDD